MDISTLSPSLQHTVAFIATCAGLQNHQRGFTHMKLQKLLYYMQGFHVGKTYSPLFPEDIEAWQYGPVIRSVWYEFRENEGDDLPLDELRQLSPFPSGYFNDYQTVLLRWVYDARGSLDAITLMQWTHREPPWKDTYRPGYGAVIPLSRLKRYFAKVQS